MSPLRPTFAAKRKALREQLALQVKMFDRLADPLLHITGRKGRIKWANQAAKDLLGGALVDRRLSDVFAAKTLQTALKDMYKGKTAQSDHIVRADNLPGREFRVRLMRLEKKTLEGARILVALSDVTEVLILQAQRADFVANASHELKTPVAALSGFIETLEQDPAALATFLPLMSQEARRMRALIQDLLRLTKTEMEPDHPPKDWLALDPLLDQAINALAPTLDRRLQTLNRQPVPTPPGYVYLVKGESTALMTVFNNLLQNASKFAPDATEIKIQIHVSEDADKERLQIAFLNKGKGIAPEHLPRLTERFYRVDDGRAPKEGGTGLGLAIVKHVLIRHRGQLHIHSAPGEGACFTVDLPCRRVEAR